jgi:hypothetical protein
MVLGPQRRSGPPRVPGLSTTLFSVPIPPNLAMTSASSAILTEPKTGRDFEHDARIISRRRLC